MIRTLISHSLVYGLTNIAARGALLVSLLVLPMILPPTDYGALAMLALAGNLASVIVPLQVSQGLARHHAAAATPAEKNSYSSSAWWFTIAAQLVFLAAGQAFAGWATERILGDRAYVPVFRIALFAMVLNSLFFLLQTQFRWAFRPGGFVALSLIYSLATLGLSIGLALVWPVPLVGVVIGQALGAGAAVGWGALRLRRELFGRIDWRRLRGMLRFAAPLVPSALCAALIAYGPRIVLNDVGTLADVGVFAFASQIATIATLAILGLQAAMTPLITLHHADPETPAALGRVFQAFCAVAVAVCLLLGLFAAEAVGWLRSSGYGAAGPLVLVLAPAVLLAEMYIFAPGFWIAKRTGLQAAVCAAAAAFALASAYLLIRAFGLTGAAAASLASSGVFFTLWWAVAARFYSVPVRWGRLAIYTGLAGAAGAAALLLTTPGTLWAVLIKAAAVGFAGLLAVLTGLVPWREGVVAAYTSLRRGAPLHPGVPN
ncbi:MAG TPA: lipopolysaccharide biosynthesis protein [Allosphingosinicella sp.]|nr:lipopolysaccharide biosynthesis protein [Allosphingosinicella sp.]